MNHLKKNPRKPTNQDLQASSVEEAGPDGLKAKSSW